MSKCGIWKCKIPATYLVSVYGYKIALCWQHLKWMHTPENDENVQCLGHIEGHEMFARLKGKLDKKLKEVDK